MNIHGIHHITAISSDAQSTYDFDDVQTYHLFIGNKNGAPAWDQRLELVEVEEIAEEELNKLHTFI